MKTRKTCLFLALMAISLISLSSCSSSPVKRFWDMIDNILMNKETSLDKDYQLAWENSLEVYTQTIRRRMYDLGQSVTVENEKAGRKIPAEQRLEKAQKDSLFIYQKPSVMDCILYCSDLVGGVIHAPKMVLQKAVPDSLRHSRKSQHFFFFLFGVNIFFVVMISIICSRLSNKMSSLNEKLDKWTEQLEDTSLKEKKRLSIEKRFLKAMKKLKKKEAQLERWQDYNLKSFELFPFLFCLLELLYLILFNNELSSLAYSRVGILSCLNVLFLTLMLLFQYLSVSNMQNKDEQGNTHSLGFAMKIAIVVAILRMFVSSVTGFLDSLLLVSSVIVAYRIWKYKIKMFDHPLLNKLAPVLFLILPMLFSHLLTLSFTYLFICVSIVGVVFLMTKGFGGAVVSNAYSAEVAQEMHNGKGLVRRDEAEQRVRARWKMEGRDLPEY